MVSYFCVKFQSLPKLKLTDVAVFVFTATSTAALGAVEEIKETDEQEQSRNFSKVEEFWSAMGRTGVQITSTNEALL